MIQLLKKQKLEMIKQMNAIYINKNAMLPVEKWTKNCHVNLKN